MAVALSHHAGLLIAALGLAVCLLAWLRGGPAERGGAAMVAFVWAIAVTLQSIVMSSTLSIWLVSLPLLLLDFLLSFGLLILALRFASLWVGVAMLAQSAQLGLHALFIADGGLHHSSYAVGSNISAVSLLIALFVGTVFSWRKRLDNVRGEAISLP